MSDTHHSTTSHPITQLPATAFPPALVEITDPPTQLYVRGVLPPKATKLLCVVGSRSATPYGRDVCQTLVKGLRGQNVAIVSGLALGMDAIAHQAALDAGLPTIAVPGSGIDDRVLYPVANRPLAHRILEAGGALLSEFDPLWKPRPESFPQRNRIMAGLSSAVLIVEAADRSGTLITARLAMEYNRDVLTVPGSIFNSYSYGPHMLIKNGATPITSVDDLLEALGLATESAVVSTYEHLSPDEQRVCTFLAAPLPRDELLRALNLPIHTANVLLSSMELKGLIKEVMGEVRLV